MNKKAWNNILNMFFVVFAFAIIFVMFIYATTEIEEAQSTENYTSMYNSTKSIQSFYDPGQALVFTMFMILTLIFILFIVGILIKFATSYGGGM